MPSDLNQHMYQRIKTDILRQIESHLLLPGDRIPTEQVLMKQYDVSRITVSRALNELKEEGIVERFPNRGTFVSQTLQSPPLVSDASVPERTAVPTGSIPEIACILPTMRDMFSLSMVNGALSAFPESEYICHIFCSANPQMENYLLKRCLDLNISGIILFPQDQPFFSDELLLMQLQKYPLVLLDRYLPRLDTSYVVADNTAAGALCLKHLHGLGHRRIAFATTSQRNTFSVKYRIDGALQEALRLGIPESSFHILEHILYGDKDNHFEDLFLKLIRQDGVTAFIASESGMGAYLYDTFRSMGINVPEEVSLMCFDNPLAPAQQPDFFTHIDQSEFIMGREAGLIIRRYLEQHATNVFHKVIAPTLKAQRSTGKAAQ